MDQGGFRSRRILIPSRMSSLHSFIIPLDDNGRDHLLHRRKSIAHSIEKSPSGAIFCRPPTFGPISTLTGGQEDQTLRQEVKGARTHCWAPSVQTFDSLRKRSTHLSSVLLSPAFVFRPLFPARFHRPPRVFRTQEKRPQVILKNGPSASAVYGLRIRVRIPSQRAWVARYTRIVDA